MTTHITDTYIEDRLAIGTLYLEGYIPIAESLKARLEVPESLAECATFTRDFRMLIVGPTDDQAP